MEAPLGFLSEPGGRPGKESEQGDQDEWNMGQRQQNGPRWIFVQDLPSLLAQGCPGWGRRGGHLGTEIKAEVKVTLQLVKDIQRQGSVPAPIPFIRPLNLMAGLQKYPRQQCMDKATQRLNFSWMLGQTSLQ